MISEVWVPSRKKRNVLVFFMAVQLEWQQERGKWGPHGGKRGPPSPCLSAQLCWTLISVDRYGAFTRPSSLIRKSCLTGHKSSSTCAKGKIKPNTTTKWDSLSTHYVVITLHCHTRSLFPFSILKGYIYKIHMHHLLCVSDCQLLTRWNCIEGKMHQTQPGRWYYIDKSNHPTV